MQNRLEWIEFLSQHRKYGYRVILCAQSDKMVDNQFRMLIEYEVKHRKLSKFGVWGWLISRLLLGRGFLWITYYYQTQERLATDWYLGNRKDFSMYDTRKKFERNSTMGN